MGSWGGYVAQLIAILWDSYYVTGEIQWLLHGNLWC